MKTNLVKTLFISFAFLFLAASLSHAQDSLKTSNQKSKSEMRMDKKMDMKSMNMSAGIHNMKMHKKDSMVKAYEGVIDLASIDVNKDGKIYQCPMDFNVLSDAPGVDPKCGMKLKEVTLKAAAKNLVKHGFEVKK